MRYKDLVNQKLEKLENGLNMVKHFSQRGEHVSVNQKIDDLKEQISSIATLLNNETQN